MGELFRRFWLPALLSGELAGPDCPPVRVRLLGEDLVAFRDSAGRIGVLDEHCPHRRASLFFGRNEECGLRCVYHGWKFDVDGACVELPSEPPHSNFRAKVRAKAYPAREAGGLVWVYMGPREQIPELPGFEFAQLAEDRRYASRWMQVCNYAQAMEGDLDSSHVGFLHRRIGELHEDKKALTGAYFQEDTWPRWSIKLTDYGMMAGASRSVDGDKTYLRVNQFLLPCYTMIAPVPGSYYTWRAWVPCDDTHCAVIAVTYCTDRPASEDEQRQWRRGEAGHRRVLPGTIQPVAHRDNDYLIDRELQRSVSYTGIDGIRAQDAAMVESQDPIADRSLERLGSSDSAIINMRKRLLQAALALEQGEAPAAAGDGARYAVRPYSVVLNETGEVDLEDCARVAAARSKDAGR